MRRAHSYERSISFIVEPCAFGPRLAPIEIVVDRVTVADCTARGSGGALELESFPRPRCCVGSPVTFDPCAPELGFSLPLSPLERYSYGPAVIRASGPRTPADRGTGTARAGPFRCGAP